MKPVKLPEVSIYPKNVRETLKTFSAALIFVLHSAETRNLKKANNEFGCCMQIVSIYFAPAGKLVPEHFSENHTRLYHFGNECHCLQQSAYYNWCPYYLYMYLYHSKIIQLVVVAWKKITVSCVIDRSYSSAVVFYDNKLCQELFSLADLMISLHLISLSEYQALYYHNNTIIIFTVWISLSEYLF